MTNDTSVLEAAAKTAKGQKTKKPSIQDLRDHFLSSELAKNLLYHRNERRFYRYNPTHFCYEPLDTPDEFNEVFDIMSVLDSFLTRHYGDSMSITTQQVRELHDALIRNNDGRLLSFPGKLSPDAEFKSAFLDGQVYNFKTGELHLASPHEVCFHYFPFPFPKTVEKTPHFDKFLTSTFVTPEGKEDPILADFMVTILAYYLSPLFPKNPFAFVLQGSGANGKSIFLSLILALMGEQYVSSLSMEDLSDRFSPVGLLGKRLNVVSEDQSRLVRADKLKAMISLERIKVERKYEDTFFMEPKVKHIFSTNKDVKFDEIDYAILRRILIIPFHRTFVSPTQSSFDPKIDNQFILPRDEEIDEKLMKELPQIFAKILERMKVLHATAFAIEFPDAFKETQRQVQEQSSSALEFFHEFYEYDPSQTEPIPTLEIYGQYENWYIQQTRPDRYKLQSKQFFSLLNKNFPGTLTADKRWSQVHKRMSACKLHLRPKKFKIAGVDPVLEPDILASPTQ